MSSLKPKYAATIDSAVLLSKKLEGLLGSPGLWGTFGPFPPLVILLVFVRVGVALGVAFACLCIGYSSLEDVCELTSVVDSVAFLRFAMLSKRFSSSVKLDACGE